MITNIPDWLKLPVPPEEIELNDDGSEFQPIWVIESLLDELCNSNWSRHSHRYSFHEMYNTFWLATSIVTEVKYTGTRRNLACSSYINLLDYSGNSNILQTGIAEATKAGVKILGSRFGYSLNKRTTSPKKRAAVKMPPDKKIRLAYAEAVSHQEQDKIKMLESIYDFSLKTMS
jgi:hypothetical protein